MTYTQEMAEIPSEWQGSIIDKAYFLQLWEPKFIEVEGLILFEAHYNSDCLQKWLQLPKALENMQKLENTINHVHLDDIAEDLELQDVIGKKLQQKWQQVARQSFPAKRFEINLVLTDNGWELQMWTK